MEVKEYYLPDFQEIETIDSKYFFIWQPDKTYIILGRSNDASSALIEENVLEDNVEVIKRPSGGETVILSPKMLVLSATSPIIKGRSSREYFIVRNNAIMEVLASFGMQNLHTKGISDVSVGEKKIMGSAIFRKTDRVFYHAVLNVEEDVHLISKYLKHPKREPDYRQNRPHTDFVSSMKMQGFTAGIEDLIRAFANYEL